MHPGVVLRTVFACATGCAVALAVLPAAASHSAAGFPGNPPIARFAPDLDVYPQNMAIAQDAGGTVYVGNAQGVLTFDGERWRLVPLPNGDLVRSLAYDGAARVYVGGYDQFGWLEPDATGTHVYHDLTPRFAGLLRGESFADIWDLLVAPEGVIFRGVRHVFLYDPRADTVRIWRHDARFGALLHHDGATLLQFRGQGGVKRLVGDDWQPVPGGETFLDLVYQFLPLPDGGLLAMGRDGLWRSLRAGRATNFAMPAGFPKPTAFNAGTALADGTLALLGNDGLLYTCDPRTGATQRTRVDTGRLSAIVRAVDGGLLMAGDEAVFHVEWPASWTGLTAADGLIGTLRGTAVWGARRLVMTGSGVFEVGVRDDASISLTPRAWTEHEAWDLLELDAGRALFAESYALKLVDARGARELTDRTFYPRLLFRSRFAPQRVLVGTEFGLGVVEGAGADWRVRLEPSDVAPLRVSSLVEATADDVWVGSERHGVHRLKLDLAKGKLAEDVALGEAQGLRYGRVPQAWVAELDDAGLVASTAGGLYRWRDGRFVPDGLDGLDALRATDEWLRLARAPDGTLWAHGDHHVYRRPPGGAWRREDVSSVRQGALARLAFNPHGEVLVTATGGVLRYHPGRDAEPPSTRVALRAVEQVTPDGVRIALPLDKPLTLERGDYGVAFRYAVPELRREGGARYRARLAGFEEQFTGWTRSTGYTYHRIAPGEYRFEVLAQDSLGRESAIEPFVLRITPPWYATRWAWAAWILLGAAALVALTVGVVRFRTRKLAADKRRLESMVTERTRELEDANRMLETMAHLDGLTGIANRRRLDEYLDQVWVQCGARSRPLSVLAIDVDHFKAFNDKHGHLAGDSLLKRLSGLLVRSLRRTEDLAARYGGEEFLVVLPGADLEVARNVAETLRQKVEASSLGTTISIGIASQVPRAGRGVKQLVEAADAALYRAKGAGRNCVELAAG